MSLVTSAATKEGTGGQRVNESGGHSLRLTKALGRGAFGGYVVEVAAGIKGAAGIMDEDIIQRVAAAAQRGLEFFAGAQRRHLAQVHDRHAVTMALRFLQ